MQRQLAELDRARKRLHRDRLARAAHADLLARRLPRAARGRGPRRGRAPAQFIQQLREQVDRLRKLATDLLDLSRLEAGSLELRPEPTDVGDAWRTTSPAEFTPALAAHESHLELRTGDERPDAECDPERVAQILRILIDNALSHTPPGTDVVVAAARRDGRVRLAVTRLRPGHPPHRPAADLRAVLHVRRRRGSGLGLAIAHELAERMDGELTADSRPGRTTFALELPA